jgi:uncharacterized protein YoxC
MIVILYFSVALISIAFLVLVIFITKTLKSLQGTLNHVSQTLGGLEKQLEGVTKETTVLLHKTNKLADDLQQKADSLTSVVDAVKDIGRTVSHFNPSLQNITNTVDKQVEDNKEKISQVIQWTNVFLELKDKWKTRKQEKALSTQNEIPVNETRKVRGR